MKNLITTMLLFAAAVSASGQTQKVEVLEYCPAPGQFVNVLPEVEEGMTKEQVLKACEDVLSKNGYLVHLGAYGGYITVKFDHPVENKRGSDILIKGNGMYSTDDPVYGKNTIGGSIEPGIVYVGVGRDLATAQWYELSGSEYHTTQCHDFNITYYKPTAEEGAHSQSGSTFDEYIRYHCTWTDKDGTPKEETGYHPKLAAHKQTYWPMWETADQLTFSGGLLPKNATKYDVDGRDYWIQYRYSEDAYGYVDASPANDKRYSSFDIDWAVDKQGLPRGARPYRLHPRLHGHLPALRTPGRNIHRDRPLPGPPPCGGLRRRPHHDNPAPQPQRACQRHHYTRFRRPEPV